MKKIIIVTVSFLMFTSCSRNNSTENKTPVSVDSTNSEKNKHSEIVELSGLYANRHFVNCSDAKNKITVNEGVQKLDSLYKSVLPTPAYPEQTVFADVKGILTSQNGEYSLAIKEVVQVEQKSFKNTCIPYDYWCVGNEPFWQVQISENENLIDFFDPMVPKLFHFNFSKSEIKGSIMTYTAEDKANNNKIKIIVTNQKCSDGMSERDYTYKSEVILNGSTYKGCAIKYGEGK